MDASDELAAVREMFTIPDGEIYLDGNSLGPVSRDVPVRVREVVGEEWATGLVRSWNDAGWMAMPTRLGDRVAPLIGARPGEVLVADTLTFMLAKLIGGALDLRPDRHVVLTDRDNFHSDLYIVHAMVERAGRPVVVKAMAREDIADALDDDVALVMLTHVDFRSGEMLDLHSITKMVHDVGALMLWDFAHSAGAVPLDVEGADVDFAAGCGYKYLNGGPGAPAFCYVRTSWQGRLKNPLPGWLGHARPFDFEPNYEAASGMQAFVTSSPSIVALAALDGALNVFDQVSIKQIRQKSLALTDLFIELVESRAADVFDLVTPREHQKRGSQVSLAHPDAYGVIQALIARGVTGDFRAPDVARFGFTPLYLRFVDVFDAVAILRDVMDAKTYLEPAFAVRKPVT
ncbi:MAG TPA: kynureninase [Acidimicrobiales bacterium]|jgi:kynureninase|nr:kynureninase [Acidimicrobiales bacterium]